MLRTALAAEFAKKFLNNLEVVQHLLGMYKRNSLSFLPSLLLSLLSSYLAKFQKVYWDQDNTTGDLQGWADQINSQLETLLKTYPLAKKEKEAPQTAQHPCLGGGEGREKGERGRGLVLG
jgi:hypothetical protein